MSRWSSDTKQRKSKRYLDTHRQLRAELEARNIILPEPSKQDRKRQASQSFRTHGE